MKVTNKIKSKKDSEIAKTHHPLWALEEGPRCGSNPQVVDSAYVHFVLNITSSNTAFGHLGDKEILTIEFITWTAIAAEWRKGVEQRD